MSDLYENKKETAFALSPYAFVEIFEEIVHDMFHSYRSAEQCCDLPTD